MINTYIYSINMFYLILLSCFEGSFMNTTDYTVIEREQS